MKQLPTIEELEKILSEGKDMDIQINPDGSITAVEKGTAKNSKVILTKLSDIPSSY